MASFEEALDVVLGHEGGGAYTDHPEDRGGPTRWGVTQETLSAHRARPVTPEEVQALSLEEAREIYRGRYWDRIRGDEIADQKVATKCLDAAVNMGPRRGAHVMQLAATWCSGKMLTLDSVVGPKTLALLNECDPACVLLELREAMRAVYLGIVALRPSQGVFLKGWLARADWGAPLPVKKKEGLA